jgi:hypothetical protein
MKKTILIMMVALVAACSTNTTKETVKTDSLTFSTDTTYVDTVGTDGSIIK